MLLFPHERNVPAIRPTFMMSVALELVRATEAAALAVHPWIGRGDGKAADAAAVEAMRAALSRVQCKGKIVIGEGSKDESAELFVGEEVGDGSGEALDIAVDPLECTDSVANGTHNAISVIAAGPSGSLLSAPDTYMYKIAVGPQARGVIDMNDTPRSNAIRVARELGKPIEELAVLILDRERHRDLITEVRSVGARVRLITDGDVAGAIATCLPKPSVDMLIGTGASAEAVIAASAIRMLGGEMLARFNPVNEGHRRIVLDAGFDSERIYTSEGLARGDDFAFAATGILDGPLLSGIVVKESGYATHSMIVHKEGGVQYIRGEYPLS